MYCGEAAEDNSAALPYPGVYSFTYYSVTETMLLGSPIPALFTATTS